MILVKMRRKHYTIQLNSSHLIKTLTEIYDVDMHVDNISIVADFLENKGINIYNYGGKSCINFMTKRDMGYAYDILKIPMHLYGFGVLRCTPRIMSRTYY